VTVAIVVLARSFRLPICSHGHDDDDDDV